MQKKNGASRWLVVALAATTLLACSKDEPKEESAKAPEPVAANQADAGESMDAERTAFGLPLPPDIVWMQRTDTLVSVQTRLSIRELESFFRSRLVDYEIVSSKANMKAIGLRAHMPSVFAMRAGGRERLVKVIYRSKPRRAKLAKKAPKAAPMDGQAPVAQARRVPQKGEAITGRDENGNLVAPGAKWGEPYKPPPGTRLNTKRNRSNFGRPYGQWIPQ
jgi:hypothetical protein